MKFPKFSIPKLLLICLIATFTFVTGRSVEAAVTWSHKWNYSTFALDNSIAGGMAAYMNNSAADYTNNTDMDQVGANGVIKAWESNFGSIAYYQGYTYPSSPSGNCYYYPSPTATGNCNTTTKKATSAVIYFNTYYLSSNRNYLARHEMGHVFGLYHPPCTDPASVMRDSNCATIYTVLQNDDKTWINNNY